jgi:hypothetical protein
MTRWMFWLRWKVGGYLIAFVVWYVLPHCEAQQALKNQVTYWAQLQRAKLYI